MSPDIEISKIKSDKLVFKLGLMHFSFLLFSFSMVFAKAASNYESICFGSVSFFLLSMLFLGIYAILWQMVLKRSSLTFAYSNKAVVYLWMLLWSLLFFKEAVTLFNILGVMIITAGVIKMVSDD